MAQRSLRSAVICLQTSGILTVAVIDYTYKSRAERLARKRGCTVAHKRGNALR